MSGTKVFRCAVCGAPLAGTRVEGTVTCHYCDSENVVAQIDDAIDRAVSSVAESLGVAYRPTAARLHG